MKRYNSNQQRQNFTKNKPRYNGKNTNKKPNFMRVNEIKGTSIVPFDGESIDSLVKRFRRVVESAGVLTELKKREFYLSPSLKRKDKSKRAAKRLKRKMANTYQRD